VLYVERAAGPAVWTDDPARMEQMRCGAGRAVRDGELGRITVERARGAGRRRLAADAGLEAAGFRPTSADSGSGPGRLRTDGDA